MGGRGSTSKLVRARNPIPAPQMQPQQNQPTQPQPNPIAQQVPDDNNTPVTPDALTSFTQMSDAQLAQVFLDSQKTGLPNHLDDAADITQRFVFYNGLNDKPMVLDSAAFNQFMSDNNINQSQILSRSINGGTLKTSAGGSRNLTPKDVADMMMYSRLNYVGGKHGGQAYGAGTYFDMNGGGNTGYASGKTVNAVLNPKTAKVISKSALLKQAAAFDKSHPQFAKATGGISASFYNNNMSVYALAMGYNVIKEDGQYGYHNIIDRKALVYRK
ncbi:MAG: hypothetical protein ACI4LP_05105 [Anaerovoracaceae bacterium]